MTAARSRGSALVMVIWTIAVLSVIVMSFAVEAKLQASVNVFVRERAQLETLVDAGRVLGEMIVANHQNAAAYSEDEDLEELLEDDRWILEKRQLKQSGATVTIGPLVVDEKLPDDLRARDEVAVADELAGRGTVTVVIEIFAHVMSRVRHRLIDRERHLLIRPLPIIPAGKLLNR